jgi:23S rRNA (uracil1939-C5)-methyltransferase
MNGIENFSILEGDVGAVLKKKDFLENFSSKVDLVIVDPPRVGLLPSAIEEILLLKPKKILYISCNPFTQRENCDVFIQNGYKVTFMQPVDQFPHTIHIENILLLERM